MNTILVRQLVAKDLSFQRMPVLAATAAGLLGIALQLSSSEGAFYVGVVLLITGVISCGIYLAFLTVVKERTQGTLPFVMSLPIGVREYTAAKLAANLILFLASWSLLGVSSAAVILTRDSVPDGLLPYAVLLLLHMLTGYALTLGVALVAGTEGWTIAAMAVSNLSFQGFLYWTAHIDDIAATMSGSVPVWTGSVRWRIAAELLTVAVILTVTWIWQSRKTDFT